MMRALTAVLLATTIAAATATATASGSPICDIDPCPPGPDDFPTAPATPAKRAVRTVASATGSGSYANADASGTAYLPTALWVKITTTPRQLADVQWTVDCTSGGDGRLTSGSFESRTSKKRRLLIPVTDPDECSFGALASLSGRGKVTVKLIARSIKH